jgi:hypothetical protein
MANLTINGAQKILNVVINDWICTSVDVSEYAYVFTFENLNNSEIYDNFIFSIITIDRKYSGTLGYELNVDMLINGNIMNGVYTNWIYAHNLITLDTFKKVLDDALQLTSEDRTIK